MRFFTCRFVVSALVLVSVFSASSGGRISYLDIMKRISDVKGDIRTNLRSIRDLAIKSGLIKPRNESATPAPVLSDPKPLELRIDPDEEVAAITEGRKKGGGGSNNNIVVAGGGGDDHGGGGYYVVESSDEGGKKRKKRRKKHKKHKGWKKHMKKAVPIGLGILALKSLLLHFVLKKLALATALSLLLSKKSLLVSALILLKLMFSHQPHHEKTESSKLEVVHIPIRKETGFHKKIQLQKKPKSKSKQIESTQKTPSYDQYSNHLIKHTHQQMEDFGGKYIPLGYESNHYNQYVITTPPGFLDAVPEASEDNFFNVDDMQFVRRDGWDGWTGWNRGDDANPYNAYEQKLQNAHNHNSNLEQGSFNSHGNGGFNRENYDQWDENNQSNYKQRNLSQMKYRRKRRLSESP